MIEVNPSQSPIVVISPSQENRIGKGEGSSCCSLYFFLWAVSNFGWPLILLALLWLAFKRKQTSVNQWKTARKRPKHAPNKEAEDLMKCNGNMWVVKEIRQMNREYPSTMPSPREKSMKRLMRRDTPIFNTATLGTVAFFPCLLCLLIDIRLRPRRDSGSST